MTTPDITRETPRGGQSLSLSEAAETWGKITGTPPPRASTLSRWASHGIRGHKLRSLVVGGRVLVSEADLRAVDDVYRWTPFHLAVMYGHEILAARLIELKSDVNAQDREGWTPLHLAGWQRHSKIAKLLIANRAAVNKQTGQGVTALHLAVNNALGGYGWQQKIDVNLKTQENSGTSIGPAEDLVRMLLSQGARVDAADTLGRTPLHYAADGAYPKVAQELLKHGANVKHRDLKGRTVVHAAAGVRYSRRGFGNFGNTAQDVIPVFLKQGVDINAQDKHGKTALDLAKGQRNKALAKYLQGQGARAGKAKGKGGTKP